MDAFDYKDESVQPRQNRGSVLLNILTILALVGAGCLCVIFAAIFFNPQVSFNPFAPPTLPALAQLPTSTPTPPSALPPTWTPTAVVEPTLTETPVPTATATLISPTVASETVPAVTPEGGLPFVLHPGDPVAIPNIGHPDQQCNWIGVAGKAYDITGAPIAEGLFVQLGGAFNGAPVDMVRMTGMDSQYGPGGYEFTLGDQPLASAQSLWLQLFDHAMIPLSEKVYFDTYSGCDSNLILINFNQVR